MTKEKLGPALWTSCNAFSTYYQEQLHIAEQSDTIQLIIVFGFQSTISCFQFKVLSTGHHLNRWCKGAMSGFPALNGKSYSYCKPIHHSQNVSTEPLGSRKVDTVSRHSPPTPTFWINKLSVITVLTSHYNFCSLFTTCRLTMYIHVL